MENSELRKKILGGIMGHMDNMASKKLKKDETTVEVDAEAEPDMKSIAEEIFNIVSEGDIVKEAKINKIVDLLKTIEGE
jgi:hypothetical protein